MKSLAVLSSRRFLPFVIMLATVCAVSLLAYTRHIPAFVSRHGIDKVLHASMAAALTYLLGRALGGRGVVAGLVVFTGLGIDEYLQRFSAARSSDVFDLLADFVGVAMALGALAWTRSRRALPTTSVPSSDPAR